VSTTRRWGVALTAVAVAMWAAVVAAIVTATPDGDANVGGGLVFLLAVPCTVTGLGLIAGSRSPLTPASKPVDAAAVEASGRRLAAGSLVLAVAGLVGGYLPLTESEPALAAQAAGTLLAGLAAVVVGGLALRRVRRRGKSRTLALTGTIAGAVALGLHGYLLTELLGFLVTGR
jgi:hypothetical protein